METEADKNISELKNHITESLELITDIIIRKCYGYDEFKNRYKNSLKQVLVKLMEIDGLI